MVLYTIQTPLRFEAIRKYVHIHRDTKYVETNLGIMKNGADIGFCGVSAALIVLNFLTAEFYADVLAKQIEN